MAGLSTAHRSALAALVSRCGDPVLKSVAGAVARLPGPRAAELRDMLAEEMRDRGRRAFVFAPVAPMFRARNDGVAAMTFPAEILARLWRIAADREPHLLPRLDDEDDRAAAIVVVEDDGPGLPEAQREAALQRGMRMDESTPGSGLGLSIVVELTRAYGGRVTLGDSDMGGLKATLELPTAEV